jgi:SAM-dependent methyltransferase
VVPDRLQYFPQIKGAFEGRKGVEIGGPSAIFRRRGCIPVYPIAAHIDNCNFGSNTVWQGTVREGETFFFDGGKSLGRQYIAEAGNLQCIGGSEYDFVLASHCLEHIANPLQALIEWKRILRQDGLLVLVLPHKDGTFDHRRPVTSMEHLIQDHGAQVTERDLTHLQEILELHDLAMDPGGETFEAFQDRSKRNFENRCLHHHVFDTRLAVEVVDHVRLEVLAVELFHPYHIVVIARKVAREHAVDNGRFRGVDRAPCWVSPFPSDHQKEFTASAAIARL